MSTAAVAENTEAPAGGKKKKKMMIIIIAALVVVLAGGGAAAFLLMKPAKHGKKAKDAGAEGEEEHADEEDAKKHPPAFVPLDNFVVNLAGADEHYLQIGITLETKDHKSEEELKVYMPMIRSKILLLLSSKTAEDLNNVDGKRKLAGEILDIAREPIGKEGKSMIKNVHFASFVIQ